MDNIKTGAAPAAPTASPAAPQPPQKVRRVGTFAFGLSLIAAGVLLLCGILIPGFDPLAVLRFLPAVLVVLGIEVLIYTAQPGVKIKYDFLSMLGCAFILFVVGGASLVPYVWDYAGPGRDTRIEALNTELETRGVAALDKVPALDDTVIDADFYVTDCGPVPASDMTGLEAVLSAGICKAHAAFTLRQGYESAEAFAADCAKTLAACGDLGLYSAYFSTYSADLPEQKPCEIYSLDLSGLRQMEATAARLAGQVTSRWHYQDATFATREDLDRYLAETETGMTEAELQQQLYQQGYDEGYAAAQAEALAPAPEQPLAPRADSAAGQPAPQT